MAKTKVAVVGGGMGGMTAAYALSSTRQLRDQYQVTVYQMGWRLGGKGASGRNADRFNSIEEHGLHIWLGFYDNAFRVMSECYEAAGETLDDYFDPTDHIVLYENYQGEWNAREFGPPPNDKVPGSGDRPDFWEVARTALEWLRLGWEELRQQEDGPLEALDQTFDALIPDALEPLVDDLEALTVDGLLDLAASLAGEAARHKELCVALRELRDLIWTYIVEPNVDHFQTRLYFQLFDTMATITCGIIEDDLLARGLDVVNDEEFTEWLARHGAKEVTLGGNAEEGSPLVRGGYDLAFGYLDGSLHQRNIAAGVGIRGLLLMLFGYKGSFMFKMKTGMGDAIFAPLYNVLRGRGVEFKFFHKVTNLSLSADKIEIEEIVLKEQAQPVGSSYRPLVDVAGKACWPSQPKWADLQNGEALRNSGIDFERDTPANAADITLVMGTDFDQVVLAIPVGALGPIAGELVNDSDNPRFALMEEHSKTVMTQAFQLWMSKPVEQLGWDFHLRSVAGSYVEPLDTYCNMTHLLPEEEWPVGHRPQSLAYFCGVLEHKDGDDWAGTQARAKANAIAFLEGDYRGIWPAAEDANSGPAIDWNLLVDQDDRSGPARFDAQYWRANFEGTERYVLSTKGSIDYRLAPDDSGYANLFLAGDWTRNGIDAGCIEAAVMSGLQAARGLTGLPIEISGEGDRWLVGRDRPYVEYGGVVTAAQPFRCEDTTLYGFILRADHRKLQKLCRRVLADPVDNRVWYEPLGNRVMLTFGHIGRITNLDPSQGYTDETQVAIWVPTAKVRKLGPVWVVDRIAWFVPYMWVDNPMTLAGGREVYGYRKNPGRMGPFGGPAGPFNLEAFGGDFGPDAKAHWAQLIRVTRTSALPSPGTGWALLSDAGRFIWDLAAEPAILLPGAGAAARFMVDMTRRQMTEVFLKQFRSVENGMMASQQRVVEAPIRVERFRGKPLLHRYQFDLSRIDSHDLEAELGLESQETSLSFEADLDFVLGRGRVIAEAI